MYNQHDSCILNLMTYLKVDCVQLQTYISLLLPGNNNLGTTVTLYGTPSAPKAKTTEAPAAAATPNISPLTHRHSIHLQQQELASGGQRKSYSEGLDDDPTAAAAVTSPTKPVRQSPGPSPNVSRGSGGAPGITPGKRISSSEEDVLIEKCSQRILTEAPECRCDEQEQDGKLLN